LNTPGVIEKYQAAAKVTNGTLSLHLEVLTKVLKKISVGSKVFDLCLFGDSAIIEELGKVYNKKQIFKGISFPTCISIN
jgi:methionine aminopeptidase